MQFEAFPLVFNDIYHFNLGVGSLPFTAFVISGGISVRINPAQVRVSVSHCCLFFFQYTVYCLYTHYHVEPRSARNNGNLAPEARLEIGLMASVFIPISLFIFGWASRASVHW